MQVSVSPIGSRLIGMIQLPQPPQLQLLLPPLSFRTHMLGFEERRKAPAAPDGEGHACNNVGRELHTARQSRAVNMAEGLR